MLGIAANVARYRFEGAGLDPDAFQVIQFAGHEEISGLFRFEVDLVAADPNVPFGAVVNQPARLTVRRDLDVVPTSGLVTRFQQAGRTDDGFHYRALLEPRVRVLSYTQRSRVFKEVSVEEIVQAVLEDHGFAAGADFRFDLREALPPRPYCVQYRETDLDFVERLLGEEGVFFFFEHDGDKDVFVAADHAAALRPIAEPAALHFDERGGRARSEETVREVVYREHLVTGTALLSDYNYRTPDVRLRPEHVGDAEMPGLYSEYGDHFPDDEQGRRRARIRAEALAVGRRQLRGVGDAPTLRSGFLFTLEEHYRDELNRDYLVVSVEHDGRQGAALPVAGDGAEAEVRYRNTFTAIPADVPFRPQMRVRRPEVPGVVSARVESTSEDGRYAYLDDQGRYHVRMDLDLDNAYGEGNASCPVRMAQAYSGPGYGMHFPNHEDTEVVLTFVNGDIDRPLALGTVPNPNNASPVVAANRMQNVLRTKAGNELVMDDTEKKTRVVLQSADLHRLLLDDDQNRVVVETTGEHRVTLDDENEHIEVRTKQGHFVRLDDRQRRVTVQSRDGHHVSIDDEAQLITMSDERGDNLFRIDVGSAQLTMESKRGSIELVAPQGAIDLRARSIHLESSGDATVEAGGDVSARAGGDFAEEAAGRFSQKGRDVHSEAVARHHVKGAQVVSEGTAKNDVQGNVVTVSGSVTQIQGGTVKVN